MFVTFEGPDGAGKSTALRSVAEGLRADGRTVLTTREPGAGEFGGKVRAILLEGGEVVPKAELFLFLADRSQHMALTIEPALARGEVVLCDRHTDSTLVYQSFARGLDEGFVRTANAFAVSGRTPDLTLLFDLDVEAAQARLTSRDRLDAEGLDFHRRVRDGFRALAANEPERFVVIDAGADEETVARVALQAVQSRLAPHS